MNENPREQKSELYKISVDGRQKAESKKKHLLINNLIRR